MSVKNPNSILCVDGAILIPVTTSLFVIVILPIVSEVNLIFIEQLSLFVGLSHSLFIKSAKSKSCVPLFMPVNVPIV